MEEDEEERSKLQISNCGLLEVMFFKLNFWK